MVEGRTLWELMERRVDATPDDLMAVDEDMRTLTFAELWSEAELAAAGLRAAGVSEDDVVTWCLPNWIETFVLVAALARLGVVQNPVVPGVGEAELERLAARSRSTLLVVPATLDGRDVEDDVTAIARRLGGVRVLVTDRALPQGDPTTLPPLEEVDPVEPRPGWDPVRWLFHTAGGTGEPKLVRHTDASLLAAARGLIQRFGLIPQDRHALLRPAAHVDGVVWLLASLGSGCANILTGSLDTDGVCEVLAREGVTLAGSTPADHRAFVDRQRRDLQPLFPDVRAFTGGGHVPPEGLVDEVRSLFDVPVLSSYGLTEAPVVAAASPSDPDLGGVTVGTPVHGVEVRLVQPDGTIATGGEEGEIRVRAPQLMAGYEDPSLDQDAFDDDGFLRTGDLGRFDEHGRLVVTGHVQDIILRPAGAVSAVELERLLHQHDRVEDAAVIGLPDPDRGEQVCAVVQPRRGAGTLTAEEVLGHLRERGLSTDDLPERVEIVDVLPRTRTGAVLKQVLRDELKG